MSGHFDARFGQQLCDVLAAELGFVCNFMGDQGRVVASSERQRIGTTHAIAARIMRGEIDEYSVSSAEASATMREGVNMGIDFAGARLISFSIVGPLAVVRPLARILRFCVTSLLRFHGEELAPEADFERSNAFVKTPADQPEIALVTRPLGQLTDLLSHASESIEHSFSRLRDTVNHIDQGISMFDSEMRLVVWNQRFLQLIDLPSTLIVFGLPMAVILRFNAERGEYGPGDVEQQVAERLALAGRHEAHVFQRTRPNGVVLQVCGKPLPDGGFVTSYTDITRQQQSEIELRAAYENAERLVEERTSELRDFAELSADWFWAQDAELRFTQFSGAFTEKLQRKLSDFIGKRRWDMPISGISAEQLAEHIACCERHQPFRDFNYEIPASDGVIQYFSISGTPLFDQRGAFIGYRGIGRNITDLRLAEQAIKESARHLSQIVDGSSIPTFVIDAEQRVTHWNQACANLTGLEPGQILGSKDVWQAFYGAARPTMANLVISGAVDEAIARHYRNFSRSSLIAGAVEAEDFFPQMGKVGRWLYFTAAPLRGRDGELSGAIETLQDITERKRDQKLLENRTEALQEAYAEMESRVAERTAELSQQLGFQQQLIEAIPGPVFYKDVESRYLGCNGAFAAFSGQQASELIGKTAHDLFPDALANSDLAADRKILQQPGSEIYEEAVRYATGEMRDVMFHKATFTRPDGTVGGLVGLMLDITERKRMEDDLRQAATVFESSAEGVIITQPDGTIIGVNPAFTEITGYTESEVLCRNPRFLQSGRHDRAFYRALWDSLTLSGRWQGELWNRRKNGEVFPERMSITAVHDQQGRLTNYVATFSDITQQKQAEERIQLLALSDPLTGLPNRRLLLDRLERALQASAGGGCYGALFFIDLDDFKGLNDTRGHYVGDMLLNQVALRIVASVDAGDTVARLGGDEFVVMLENLGADVAVATGRAMTAGKKILATLNQPYVLQECQHHSTPSIGVTLFGEKPDVLEDLLIQADLAMYQAKASGRNALRFFDPGMQAVVAARVALEADLRQGLRSRQFILYYQPQVDMAHRVTGAEALIRWLHPQRGLVSPAEFIPLAEETGLILPLGRWVLETACAQLSAWARAPETAHLSLAVNVSANQFRQPDFVAEVLAILERHATNPEKLKLELTESLLLNDVEEIIAKIMQLKAHGISFSLDDFGTGYSSLSYLKRLPLDQLKIDQSFVHDALVDPNSVAIVRTIIALAHSLGMAVIAEGVETAGQLAFLASHGCHAYQGYLFSRPLPLLAFMGFLQAAPTGEQKLENAGLPIMVSDAN
jgi:diguanylate cyclase (GGDEF)-like protein/PAS domain S-box-containing protein